MAATDYMTAVDQRVWALLEAHAPFTDKVLVPNRIKMCGGATDPLKSTWNDGDFPECIVDVSEAVDSLFTLEEHYGFKNFNPSASPWTEEITLNVALQIVHKTLRRIDANPLVAESLTAIRKGGPNLWITGAPFKVLRVGPVRTTFARTQQPINPSDPGGTMRLASVSTFPVVLRFKGSELIV